MRAADKENIGRIDLYKLLMRVLAASLGRNVCYRAFKQLQQRLLHALAGYVACDGCILALTGDLIYLVNVDYALFGALNVKIGSLQKPQKNILNVFADIAGFGESRCIGYCKGTLSILARDCANRVLPLPVGPMSRILLF